MRSTHVHSSRPHATYINFLCLLLLRRSVTMSEKSTPGGSADLPPTEKAAPFSERQMAWIANIVAGTSAQSLPPSSESM